MKYDFRISKFMELHQNKTVIETCELQYSDRKGKISSKLKKVCNCGRYFGSPLRITSFYNATFNFCKFLWKLCFLAQNDWEIFTKSCF